MFGVGCLVLFLFGVCWFVFGFCLCSLYVVCCLLVADGRVVIAIGCLLCVVFVC